MVALRSGEIPHVALHLEKARQPGIRGLLISLERSLEGLEGDGAFSILLERKRSST